MFRQDFTYRGVSMSNVVALFKPDSPRRVLLCAHWDTRPVADMEIDAAKRRQPILGANDGASGVAVLLELARLLKQKPPDVGVVIALFDGEDFGDFSRNEGVAFDVSGAHEPIYYRSRTRPDGLLAAVDSWRRDRRVPMASVRALSDAFIARFDRLTQANLLPCLPPELAAVPRANIQFLPIRDAWFSGSMNYLGRRRRPDPRSPDPDLPNPIGRPGSDLWPGLWRRGAVGGTAASR